MFKWFADRAPVARRVREEEQGFTLIELLVVVIIIGILAAIAIPVFLSQRGNAQQAAVSADARAAGTAMSACLTEGTGTCNTSAGLRPYGYSESNAVTTSYPTATTIRVVHDDNASAVATYDNATGNISP